MGRGSILDNNIFGFVPYDDGWGDESFQDENYYGEEGYEPSYFQSPSYGEHANVSTRPYPPPDMYPMAEPPHVQMGRGRYGSVPIDYPQSFQEGGLASLPGGGLDFSSLTSIDFGGIPDLSGLSDADLSELQAAYSQSQLPFGAPSSYAPWLDTLDASAWGANQQPEVPDPFGTPEISPVYPMDEPVEFQDPALIEYAEAADLPYQSVSPEGLDYGTSLSPSGGHHPFFGAPGQGGLADLGNSPEFDLSNSLGTGDPNLPFGEVGVEPPLISAPPPSPVDQSQLPLGAPPSYDIPGIDQIQRRLAEIEDENERESLLGDHYNPYIGDDSFLFGSGQSDTENDFNLFESERLGPSEYREIGWGRFPDAGERIYPDWMNGDTDALGGIWDPEGLIASQLDSGRLRFPGMAERAEQQRTGLGGDALEVLSRGNEPDFFLGGDYSTGIGNEADPVGAGSTGTGNEDDIFESPTETPFLETPGDGQDRDEPGGIENPLPAESGQTGVETGSDQTVVETGSDQTGGDEDDIYSDVGLRFRPGYELSDEQERILDRAITFQVHSTNLEAGLTDAISELFLNAEGERGFYQLGDITEPQMDDVDKVNIFYAGIPDLIADLRSRLSEITEEMDGSELHQGSPDGNEVSLWTYFYDEFPSLSDDQFGPVGYWNNAFSDTVHLLLALEWMSGDPDDAFSADDEAAHRDAQDEDETAVFQFGLATDNNVAELRSRHLTQYQSDLLDLLEVERAQVLVGIMDAARKPQERGYRPNTFPESEAEARNISNNEYNIDHYNSWLSRINAERSRGTRTEYSDGTVVYDEVALPPLDFSDPLTGITTITSDEVREAGYELPGEDVDFIYTEGRDSGYGADGSLIRELIHGGDGPDEDPGQYSLYYYDNEIENMLDDTEEGSSPNEELDPRNSNLGSNLEAANAAVDLAQQDLDYYLGLEADGTLFGGHNLTTEFKNAFMQDIRNRLQDLINRRDEIQAELNEEEGISGTEPGGGSEGGLVKLFANGDLVEGGLGGLRDNGGPLPLGNQQIPGGMPLPPDLDIEMLQQVLGGGLGMESPVGGDMMTGGEHTDQELLSVTQEAEAALNGTHPNPEEAIANFVEIFGEPALMALQSGIEELPDGLEDFQASIAQAGFGEPGNAGSILDGMSGDGMSDSVPGHIDGREEVKLSSGEFVVPADVVSHIGNGDTNSGADRLATLVDEIRIARGSSAGMPTQIDFESIS